jgi:hypothetical protein
MDWWDWFLLETPGSPAILDSTNPAHAIERSAINGAIDIRQSAFILTDPAARAAVEISNRALTKRLRRRQRERRLACDSTLSSNEPGRQVRQADLLVSPRHVDGALSL